MNENEEAPLPAEAGKGATPSFLWDENAPGTGPGANRKSMPPGQPGAGMPEDSEILRFAQNDKGQPGAAVPHEARLRRATPREPRAHGSEMNVVDELKTVAISRLLLDNIEHIKSFWPMLGVETAQMALCFGADDLDGTVREYRIVERDSHGHTCNACGDRTSPKLADSLEAATPSEEKTAYLRARLRYEATTPSSKNYLSVKQIRRMIEETGREAVQRDGFYKRVEE